MTLTPADVRGVQFSTTKMKTGYDMDEVDAFLDVVEADLGQLVTQAQAARDSEAVLRAQCEQLLTRVSELERRLNEARSQVTSAQLAALPGAGVDVSIASAQQSAAEIISAARAEAAGIRSRLAADLRAGIAAVERYS
ncbi:MAG: DivIVA domain-containing protein [Actinomycetales bacterium]|nr:DivIVA domain-containing protein [Actinomycetales bacterium]